jgi:uncharacterized membrane protein
MTHIEYTQPTFRSGLSDLDFPVYQQVKVSTIRKSLADHILKKHANLNEESLISISELNTLRDEYMSAFFEKQARRLNKLRNATDIVSKERDTFSQSIVFGEDTPTTKGQALADKVASFGGSWMFISLFGFFIFLWILLNVLVYKNSGYDPYPFILLNLILSCIAALQAPIIMMSQNRQEEKDRKRARQDFLINVKAENEIRSLHHKIDHLILHQQEELIEIQKIQIDMMNDIMTSLLIK